MVSGRHMASSRQKSARHVLSTPAFRLGAALLVVISSTGCEPSPLVSAAKPENIVIAVDKDGNFSWNGEQVSCAEVAARMNMGANDLCGSFDDLDRVVYKLRNAD